MVETGLNNERLDKKIVLIQKKVFDIERNFLKTRNKRGISIVAGIGIFCRIRGSKSWIVYGLTQQS